MSITFRIGDQGTTGSARTINSIAGNVLSLSGTLTGNVGDILVIAGSGGAGNDGYYTVIAGLGTASVTVRPTPNATGGGTAQMLTRATSKARAATSVSSITPIGGGLAVLYVPGCDFINAAAATNRMRPNDHVALSGDSDAANNGGWYVHGEPLSDERIVVRPPDGGAGMNASGGGAPVIATRYGIHRLIITNESQWGRLTGSPTLTFVAASSQIRRSAGSWVTDGFRIGESTVIDNTVSNNSTGRTITNIITTTNPNDTLVMSAAGTDETVVGAYVEVNTLSWAYVLANATPLAAPTNSFGSGSIYDLLQPYQVAARRGFKVSFSTIELAQTGLSGEAIWTSENEVVTIDRQGNSGAGGDGSGGVNRARFVSSGVPTQFRLGRQSGDALSAENGSAWLGLYLTGQKVRSYGSYYDMIGVGQVAVTAGSEWVASIWRPDTQLNGSGNRIASSVFYGTTGVLLLGATAAQSNVIVTSQTALASMTGTIEGLVISEDKVAGPWFATGPITLLDPQADYDTTLYFSGANVTTKRFTYNPRYVSKVTPAAAGSPISGLTVRIFEVDALGNETQVFSGTTNVDGRINGGVGTALRRQASTFLGATNDLFTHRVLVMGPGFQVLNGPLTMTAKLTGDITVPRLVPNYEEEYLPV